MAKKARSSAYTSLELERVLEASQVHTVVTDSLSSDEEAGATIGGAKAVEKQEQVKRGRKNRRRSSKAGKASEILDGVKSAVAKGIKSVVEQVPSLPLSLNGAGNSTNEDHSDGQEVDELAEGTSDSTGQTKVAGRAPSASLASQVNGSGADARDTATPTPAQQQPQKRKRGRPSKASKEANKSIPASAIAAAAEATQTDASQASALPATSTSVPKKRRKSTKARRDSLPPAVEVQDSLFNTQSGASPKAQDDEDDQPLFRAASVETAEGAPPPPSNPHPSSTKRKHSAEGDNDVTESQNSVIQPAKKKTKRDSKGKGKAKTTTSAPAKSSQDSAANVSSTEEEEEEIQKSLVQELPKRKSAKKDKGKGKEVIAPASSPSKAANSSKAKRTAKPAAAPSTGAAVTAATPSTTKSASKAKPKKSVAAASTPQPSGSGTGSQGSARAFGSPTRPKWIKDRLRKITAIQYKSYLAHRTRSPDRARGNPFSEEEEITLILALNDIYDEAGNNKEDVTKNNYKRWRKVQEMHGLHGYLSDVLRERSNVDLKDKARNIQKYREQLGLPAFNWYTYPRVRANAESEDEAAEEE